MDFRKLAFAIIFLGVLITGYGQIKFLVNGPVSEGGGLFPSPFAMDENMLRGIERNRAIAIAVVGGVVIFIGGAILFAAKKPRK
jgi:hypothetical protein